MCPLASDDKADWWAQDLRMSRSRGLLSLGDIERMRQRRDWAQAERALRARLAADPGETDAWMLLAAIAQERGDRGAAEAVYHKVLSLSGQHFEAHVQLGVLLARRGATADAVAQYEAALALRPSHPLALRNLGALLRTGARVEEAIDALERARAQVPHDAETLAHLGAALSARGESDRALPHLLEAVERAPENTDHPDTLLLVAHYGDALGPDEIARLHRRVGERRARGVEPLPRRDVSARRSRRLRVGYVSADFRRHSVAFFLEPLLVHRDRARVEVILFSQTRQLDDVSRRLLALVDGWRDITSLDDDEAAALIRAADIDVLVDLSGHTNGNRLGVFARRPAPVQVTYLGYPNTTGLEAMDFRITDADSDPIGLSETLHTERLIRLDPGFLCYGPPADAPEPAPVPSTTGRPPTFGSFNALSKISASTLALWASVLRDAPEARLLLKHGYLSHPQSRASFVARLREHDLPIERIDLVGFDAELPAHLEAYRHVDVALDTTPYHGTTTTCDALFMGVPVVTLAGKVHASRVGVSLLRRAGLDDLVAESPADYARIAVALLRDEPRRVAFRAEARARLASGGLTDGPRMARAFDDALCRAAETRLAAPEFPEEPCAWQHSAPPPAVPDVDAIWRVVGPGIRIAAPAVPNDALAWQLDEHGDVCDDESHFLRGLLRPGDRALDLGSSHGLEALSFAHAVGPAGRVRAFPATSREAVRLRASVSANAWTHVDVVEPSTPTGGADEFGFNPSASSVPHERAAHPHLLVARVEAGVPLSRVDALLDREFALRPVLWVVALRQAAAAPDSPRSFQAIEALRARGCASLRLAPGPSLLVPYSGEADADPLLHTLFAVHPRDVFLLASRGFLAEREVENLPALPAWEQALPSRLLARHPGLRAGLEADGPGKRAHRDALACFALAHHPGNSPEVRAGALRRALAQAIAAVDGLTELARFATLSRVAFASGHRALAVETLRTALAVASRPGTRLEEPFLAPSPRFDALDTGGRLVDFALAAILEQLERLRARSTFAAREPEALARHALFEQRGFPSPEMARRRLLLARRGG
jgi:predicted O-linked N-acetylglucosamine transferase (SPINDLY family)